MEIKEITVTYGRKFNLGNYEQLHIELTASADLASGDNVAQAELELFERVKTTVKAQALPVIVHSKQQQELPPPPEDDYAEIEAELSSMPPPKAPVDNGPQTEHEAALSFEAETLVGSIHNGKEYWKVKGGRFAKFGVTIWPEVLNRAIADNTLFDINEELDVRNEYNLTGLIAYYEENDKGQPAKVTSLVRAKA